MNFRSIVTRDAFWDKNPCPYFMCSGDGVQKIGFPGREWEVPCLCVKDEKKLEVDSDEGERRFDLLAV